MNGATMNHGERDPYGMFKPDPTGATGLSRSHGPGPEIMGAATLTGDTARNTQKAQPV